MTTINISLPTQLKAQADYLVQSGLYVSFSDLVRSCLRREIKESRYDLMAKQAEEDMAAGKGKILRNSKEIDKYFDSIAASIKAENGQ